MHHLLEVLTDAVLAGAAEVVAVRRSGSIGGAYKDATELVTEADRRSDAAILAVLTDRCRAIDAAICFQLEESGLSGAPGPKRIGADPLDGTNHFAAGGNLYCVQAVYLEDGVPLVGVVFQPEVYVPLTVDERPSGRLVSAVRGEGAFVRRSVLVSDRFVLGAPQRVVRRPGVKRRSYVGCVPVTGRMTPDERALAHNVLESGLIGGTIGAGCAGGNVMMIVFGGQDVYMNFGAGVDLDLAPPQVIAQEVGLTVWGPDRRPPVWQVRKQPVIVALDEELAETFLRAAGL